MFTVPTKRGEDSAQKKVIDTSYLQEEDLKTLKKQDPFLYFSIPAVRTAAHLSRDVNMSCLRDVRSSRRESCPGQIQSTPITKVERQSRISFECHTDLIMEGILDDIEDLNNSDEFNFVSILDELNNHAKIREKKEKYES